jgi:vanillate/3-O-methylgallate O-demethylase
MSTIYQHNVPITPQIPVAPGATSYTRFCVAFEPYEFSGWVDECMSWKNTCYVGDWSPLSNKFLVKGPDAIRFYSDISVNSFAKFDVGQAKHSIQCNEAGQVMCEGVLLRLAEDELLFTSGPSFWAEYRFQKGGYDATGTQLGMSRFIIQVQGPNSLFVLEKAARTSLRDIGFMRFREASIEGMPFDLLRQGMSGELGYELHGDSEYAVAIHQAILDAGQEFGIRRLGGRAKCVNHVEACFPTPSIDFAPAVQSDPDYVAFCDARMPDFARLGRIPSAGSYVPTDISDHFRTPLELGWKKNIKFDHDFIGRAALEKAVAEQKRTMVTLVWNKEDVLDVQASLYRDGDAYEYMEMPRNLLGTMWCSRVMKGDRMVGIATSRCYSYFFRDTLSLCTIDLNCAEPGTEVSVLWGSPGYPVKEIRAVVAPAPYKRDSRKIDVSQLPSYI